MTTETLAAAMAKAGARLDIRRACADLVESKDGTDLALHLSMPGRHFEEEDAGLDGPDYVTLVIEWDNIADELECGTATAVMDTMPTKDSDWVVDQAGLESFPASDPPAWGSSHAATSSETANETRPKKRSARIPILIGVLALFSLTGFLGVRHWLAQR